MQSKRGREAARAVNDEEAPYIWFMGVLRYREDNLQFVEKLGGDDTRTAAQKRHYVWREITKMPKRRR